MKVSAYKRSRWSLSTSVIVRADERNADRVDNTVKFEQVLPMLASLLQKIKVRHMSIL